MRILAIRGKNLASLSAEFCVDFQSEPLASAGLFAITGATGAGKSTLLDALCLALYEKTPRLIRATAKGESIPDVGDNSLGPADARTILRRGASEGFAEVDFVGSDGVGYRSRWSVRRARNKADGKLQGSEISLLRLHDGQVLGDHRKTETLKLIETSIGLNFEQFTRAVLLAQNDFAAFLKTSDDDRAELLQTLTGTETFSRISMLAYARMKAENDTLKQLTLQLEDQAPLAAEDRAAKEAGLEALGVSVKAIEQQKALLEGHLRWHQQAEKLQLSELEASKTLEAARFANASAGGRQQHLARLDAVQAARPWCADEDRLQADITQGDKRLKESEATLVEAIKLVATHQLAEAAASGRGQQIEAERIKAQPAIDLAKALDVKLLDLNPRHLAAVKARDAARLKLEQESTRRSALQKAQVEAQGALLSVDQWLLDHRHFQPLAESWPRWETLLGQAAAQVGEANRISMQLAEMTKKEAELGAAGRKATADQQASQSAQQTANAQLAALTQACAAFNADEMARQKQALESRRDDLLSLAQLWQNLGEQQTRLQTLGSQQQAQRVVLADSEASLRQCQTEKPLAERDLAGAEKAFSIAQLAASASAEAMRARLEAAAPCPVCGATEHPYALHQPPVDAVLGELQKEIARCRQALSQLVERSGAATAQKAAAERQLAQLAAEHLAASKALTQTSDAWAAHALRELILPVPESARGDWLGEQQHTVKTELAGLAGQETAYRELLRQKDQAQAAVNKAQAKLDVCQQTLSDLTNMLRSTAQNRENAQQMLAGIERQIAQLLDDLDAAFSTAAWRDVWAADAQGFITQCRAEVDAWRGQQQKRLDLATQITTRTTALQGLDETCANATQHLNTLGEQAATLAQEVQAVQAERKLLFDGKPMDVLEAEFASASHAAKTELTRCQTARQQAAAEQARLEEAVRQTSAARDKSQTALQLAQQALADWLQAFNAQDDTVALDRAGLRELLQADAEWIASERAALQALERSVATADAVLKAHQQASATHAQGKPGDQSADVLRDELLKASAELTSLGDRLSALKVEIARDDERLLKSAALRAGIEQQTAKARVWSQLSELIGAADGKKFRNFAQQLTLDILLGYANRHLESLSRRYRLERVRDSLGLLVVDQDMGDEIRSVHSLSGGESFLVSLALALGLASLSSHRVRVESLFIDEGFGSLDADSLGVAMEALDKLQAQGRKVGVISHVQEMTERIGTRVQVRRLAGGQSRVVVS